MGKRVSGAVLLATRSLVDTTGVADRELLRRFAEGDEAAFAALVARHSGMVLGVCRRTLPTVQDAEDACQATFLVLARKSKTNRWQASVANWLYLTARRIAAKANRAAQRRAKREARAVPAEAPSALDQMTGREAFAALDAELERLPDIYREPLVLCYLEGVTRDEAAARLGVPPATVKSQLERGRKRLGDALTKRGIVLGAGLLAVALTSPARAASPRLMKSILSAVGGSPSPSAAVLAQGGAVNGMLTNAKMALLAVAGLALVGAGAATLPTAAEPQKPPVEKREKPPAKADAKGETPKAEPTKRTLSGKVLGPDGKPVAAELFLLSLKASPEVLGKTAADGTFKVTVPFRKDDGAYLVAKADGLGIDFLTPLVSTPDDVTLKLTRDNPVRGRVIDTQGKPVAGATVTPHLLFDFAGGKADAFLNEWKTRHPQSGVPSGQNNMWMNQQTRFNLPDGRLLLAAKTDADGKFEIAGVGAERVVNLLVRGAGVADAEVYVVNREKFDSGPVNQAAADARERLLPKSMGKFGLFPQLYGPTPTVIAEREKVIRGVVKDRATGKPRANVDVSFLRVSNLELLTHGHSAKTDKDGKFELRGSRKHDSYVIETYADPDAGYLPCQVEAKDTVGYEPIAVEIGCAKGVVVSGRMTDKETGKPIAGQVFATPLFDNPFLKKYPTMDRSASGMSRQNVGAEDGSFRIVTVPGPVLLMGGTNRHDTQFQYKPPQPDPGHPKYFHREFGTLGFYTGGGGRGFVQGNWCKVLEIKETDTAVVQNIELEPSARKPVRIVDADGKPVSGCEAAGLGWRNWAHPTALETDTATAYGIEGAEERLIAVGHPKRKLVGAAVVKAGDKDPVVQLGEGGAVSGRVVDEGGTPVEGAIVVLHFEQREVAEVFGRMTRPHQTVTDAKGGFRFDHLTPGYKFRFTFSKGKKNFGPDFRQAPRYQTDKHGETKDLGDQKIQTTLGGE